MPSIIPGFEYDIFISYRHNDNRSGWVTEFVRALEEELASTIKESISVYFDTNPHDGLLETHNVDKSLEGKLKCLIFIPILSQTYCDPKSFAWQHEFCAFNKVTKEDQFGRDIKLNNGNVASRILPVKIHDFDAEDKATIESEIGGVLRAIAFIFKAPGVNRPLTLNDQREENSDKTFFRDQINKTANAIKEIITSLKSGHVNSTAHHSNENAARQSNTQSSKIRLTVAFFVMSFLLMAGFYFFTSDKKNKSEIKRVAILPFKLIGDPNGEYFAAGMKEALTHHLQTLPQIEMPPSLTETERYRQTTLSRMAIANELKTDYIIEGTTQKWRDSIQMFIQLVDPFADKILWKADYQEPFTKIFEVQSNLAKQIAQSLSLSFSPDLLEKIGHQLTSNTAAYDLYLQGRQWQLLWAKSGTNTFLSKARVFYKKSIDKDPLFAEPYYYLASTMVFSPADSTLPLLNRAISIEPKFSNALNLKSQILFLAKDTANSLKLAQEAIKADAKNQESIMWLGWLYDYWLNDDREIAGLQQYINAYNVDPNYEGNNFILWNIGLFFQNMSDYERCEAFIKKGLLLVQDDYRILNAMGSIYLESGQFKKLFDVVDKMKKAHEQNFKDNYDHLYWQAVADLYNGKYKEGLGQFEEFLTKTKDGKNGLPSLGKRNSQIEYAVLLLKNGAVAKAYSVCEVIIKKAKDEGNEIWPKNLDLPMHAQLCRAYALMGRKEDALNSLEKIKFHRIYPGLHEFLTVDCAVESLWKEPRFAEVVKRERNKSKLIRERVRQMEKDGVLVIPDIK